MASKLQAKMKVRFPNLSDLPAYLQVEAVIMKNVRMELKRVPDDSYSWKVRTAYTINDAPQLRPDAADKWTGNIRTTEADAARKIGAQSY